MSKMICMAAALLLFTNLANAQGNGQLAGKITDSTGKNPLPLSTVTIFKAKDTSIVTYRLSGEKGEFKIPGLPLDVPLRVLVTFAGYEGYRKEFTLTKNNAAADLGTIKMTSTSKQLDEVIVIAERPPIVVRKDTVEFNASSFKTLPNAYVEDLLKKLPGVQIDAEGNLTVNGRRVNRIMVDGKNFFNEDTKMATKNLPSTFIDKVQITDDKDEIAQKNDGDLSDVGKVINLTLKKNVKKQWFGRVYAGAGTQERYDLGGNINNMRDTLQMSFNGSANNNNRGNQRSGLSTSNNFGVNLNYTPRKNLSFSGQYNYNGNETSVSRTRNELRFIGDTTINTNTIGQSVSTGNNHRISIGGNWRKDTLTNMNFRVEYAYNGSDSYAPSDINIENNKLGILSKAVSLLFSNSKNNRFSQNFSVSMRSKKKRSRNFSFNESINFGTNPYYATTENNNDYFYPVVSNQVFSQMRLTQSPSLSINMNGSYSEDLSKKWVLRANSRLDFSQRTQDLFTYSKPVNGSKYDSLNQLLSSHLQRNHTTFGNQVGIGYRINKLTISLNANWLQQWITNHFDLNGTKGKLYYSNILPSITANWNRFNLSLMRGMSIPGINYLNPVPDNSNPYYISYGNPDLLPSRSTSINFNGNMYKPKSAVNISIHSSISFTDNSVLQMVTLNTNGVQVSRPVNVNGMMNAYVYGNFSKQFRKGQKFLLTTNFSLSGSISKNPIFFNGVQSNSNNLNINPSFGVTLDWDDKVEFYPSYMPNYNRSVYSNRQFANREVVTHNFNGQLTLRPTKKIILGSALNYRYNNQVSPGLPKSNAYWTASISTLMLKDSKGQLKLDVYDILNSNNSYSRYISANSIVDSESNVLKRFFMLSFIYNIRPAGAKNNNNRGPMSLPMGVEINRF